MTAMSDPLRASSRALSVSGSPGRPSPLSRPHWPWSTYTHRSSPSSSYVYTSSSSTPIPQIWDPRSSMSSPSTVTHSNPTVAKRGAGLTVMIDHANLQEEASMRQWSFTAFEWVVRDVHKLRDFVENSDTTDTPVEPDEATNLGDFEILKESPELGDGKFKLEIARTPLPESSEATVTQGDRTPLHILSLFITSLMVDYANTGYEMSTTMFAAIKCQDDRVGERGARAEWVWEYWHNGWVFRQESEVWECPLPPLSSLLENSRIKETDSFVICVQMHSPVGPFFPQQPSAYYVPRDLLDGLEASLDNPNTGDVQFVCLERQVHEVDPPPNTPSTADPPSGPRIIARKRVIYAHSDILTRRSEYFATMLSSAFAENGQGHLFPSERKVYTIVVEEADFVTMYWLLKFVYANWLLFRKDDDPREAVDGIGAGWSARGISTPGAADEWEWKTFSKGMTLEPSSSGGISDARSVTSAESAVSNGGSPRSRTKSGPGQPVPAMQSTSQRTPSSSKATSASSRLSASQARRSGPASTPSGPSTLALPSTSTTSPATSRSTKAVPVPISPPAGAYTSPGHYPISPRQPRQRSHPPTVSSTDPHVHPTPAPTPASALSMYQIAHRYAMPGLASLALEHILSTITPQSSFAVLLATSAWDELRSLVEDYVVEKWDEVSVSGEFERCCQEVAGGEWGSEGGKTLMALFRRLRSPSVVVS